MNNLNIFILYLEPKSALEHQLSLIKQIKKNEEAIPINQKVFAPSIFLPVYHREPYGTGEF
jgi:hypothetical protein